MAEKKITYPQDWDIPNMEKWTAIDEECLINKNTVIDLQKQIQGQYMIWYLKQYEIRESINNTLKTFVEKGWKTGKREVYQPVVTDFNDVEEFNAYTEHATHLFKLYGEREVCQATLRTLRLELLDIKRFPKNG